VAQLVGVLAVRRGALREDRDDFRALERVDRGVTAVLRGLVVDGRLEVAAEVVRLRRQGRLFEGRSVCECSTRAVTNTARVAVFDRAQTVGAGRGCEDSGLVGDGIGSKDVRGLVC